MYFQITARYNIYTESIVIQILETQMTQRTFSVTMTIELSDDETQRFMEMIETLDLVDAMRFAIHDKFGMDRIVKDDVQTDRSYHDQSTH